VRTFKGELEKQLESFGRVDNDIIVGDSDNLLRGE
jgi:hypothetical protein